MIYQAFIQAVLLMPVFEQRFSFSNVVKCRWGSPGDVRSATGLWWSPDGGSAGKTPEKFWSFYIWETNK